MGGDLNGKKSFHPSKWRNQAKVFQAEEAAREEKKKISQIQREREEERFQEHLKELQQSHQITSEKPAVDPKLSWMYQGPLESTAVLDESRVAYLLGKRHVDNLSLRPNQDVKEKVPGDLERAASTSTVAKDTSSKVSSKVLEDPLLAIHKARHQQERDQAKKERIAHKSLSRRSRRGILARGPALPFAKLPQSIPGILGIPTPNHVVPHRLRSNLITGQVN
ncbi:MAG: RNA-splicing factor [Bogoriella megaspora]|nr:MAG: RNA-splicing factor [Bogoriella megaspora]